VTYASGGFTLILIEVYTYGSCVTVARSYTINMYTSLLWQQKTIS